MASPCSPLFADLRGRTVLVVGGGAVARRKVEALLEAGARVRVGAPALDRSAGAAGRRRPHRAPGRRIRRRAGSTSAWLAIAATDDARSTVPSPRPREARRDLGQRRRRRRALQRPAAGPGRTRPAAGRDLQRRRRADAGAAPARAAGNRSSTIPSARWPTCSPASARASARASRTSAHAAASSTACWPARCRRLLRQRRQLAARARAQRRRCADGRPAPARLASPWSAPDRAIRAC